jgi:hypothetical protein
LGGNFDFILKLVNRLFDYKKFGVFLWLIIIMDKDKPYDDFLDLEW